MPIIKKYNTTTLAWEEVDYSASKVGIVDAGNKYTATNVEDVLQEISTNITNVDTASNLLAKIKTVDGIGSGLDADTVDGLHASSFMGGVKVYGTNAFTDAIAASGSLTKNIALGGAYKNGIAVIKHTSLVYSIVVFFGTNSIKTKVTGLGQYYNVWTRENAGSITQGASSPTFGDRVASGVSKLYIKEVYINGTNLQIDFGSAETVSTYSLDCTVYWEVW